MIILSQITFLREKHYKVFDRKFGFDDEKKWKQFVLTHKSIFPHQTRQALPKRLFSSNPRAMLHKKRRKKFLSEFQCTGLFCVERGRLCIISPREVNNLLLVREDLNFAPS